MTLQKISKALDDFAIAGPDADRIIVALSGLSDDDVSNLWLACYRAGHACGHKDGEFAQAFRRPHLSPYSGWTGS